MICPNCGCENDDKNIKCEVCGTEFAKNDDIEDVSSNDKKSVDKNKIIIISLIMAIVVVIIVSIAVVVSLNKNNENTFDAISNLNTTDDHAFTNDYDDTIHIQDDESGIDETNEYDTTVKPKTQTPNSTTRSEKEINREKALDCLKKADAALKNGEREDALQMADAALEFCKDDDIKKKYDKIYEYAPFNMFKYNNVLKVNLNAKNYYGNIFLYDRDIDSNKSDNYSHCIVFQTYDSYPDDYIDMYYNLSGKYDSVSGTIFLPAENKNTNQENCFITIYGDGKKLYTSKVIISGSLEEKFTINVKGIETLVVSYHRDSDNFSEYAIADLVALKNLP